MVENLKNSVQITLSRSAFQGHVTSASENHATCCKSARTDWLHHTVHTFNDHLSPWCSTVNNAIFGHYNQPARPMASAFMFS